MKCSTSPHPNSGDKPSQKQLLHRTRDERVAFLRFVRFRLPDDDPLKFRIDEAIGVLTQRPRQLIDEVTAEEVKSTEVAAWRAIEAPKEVSLKEVAQIGDEYRDMKLSRFEQLMSLNQGISGEWRVLEEAFEILHRENPGLVGWVHINESPMPVGPGSLHFRELGNRAIWALARLEGDDVWKCWLEVLVGYLLKSDPQEEYLHTMKVSYLTRPEGSTIETHPGVIIDGESYRIDHLSKASALCCSWLGLNVGRHQSASERTQSEPMPLSMKGDPLASRRSAKDELVVTHSKIETENPLLAAMDRQGLNAPRLAKQVRAVLKKWRITKRKVDRTTIYRLVSGITKNPDPAIRRAVLEILNLPLE